MQLLTSDKFHRQSHAVQSLQHMLSTPAALQTSVQQVSITMTNN